MNKYLKSIYKFEIALLILILLLFTIQQNSTYKYLVSIIVLGIILIVASREYKKKKDTNLFRGAAFRILTSVLIAFFIVIYLLGLLMGFNKTYFSLNPNSWMQGLIPVFIITVILERLKFILIKNNSEEKKNIYVITVLTILLNVAVFSNIYNIDNNYKLFIFVCVTLLPIIAQELLTSFIIYNYGLLPALTYKLVMNLYVYVLPITTNLGDYLYSAINIIMPFTIYYVLFKYLKTNEEIRKQKKKISRVNFNFITIPTIILLTIIIVLVSGIFRYQMVAIASNSMVPTFERGDAIILEKIDKQDIEEGDVIVFKRNEVLVAHRVVKTKDDSSKIYFYTKGDANASVDVGYRAEEDVIGIVRRVVKYIGYPTVLINELFGGEVRENK